ncbi:uncharacterized protein LOC141631122 [Silene latifolia]|uniref:uncharacterized protein LOC141631122 n=1 Tax=Silene latifolia TaxID=37657 RepID=UPI003D784288
MKVAAWNVRGFNTPLKQNEAKEYMRNNKLDLFAILETRVKHAKASKILNTKFGSWGSLTNYGSHYNGRIWLLYNSQTVALSHHLLEAQVISCRVHHFETGKDLNVSFVYGSNDAVQRKDLWGTLRGLASSDPWLVLGDFNIVRCPEEKLSPNPPLLQDMLDFNSVCLTVAG